MNRLLNAFDGFFGLFQYLYSPLILLMRIHWGWLFFASGFKKFGAIEGTATYLASLGIPFSEYAVYLVATVELLGGLFLLFGFLSRLAAFPLFIVMVVAYSTADLSHVTSIGPGFVSWFSNILAWNTPEVFASTPFTTFVGGSPFFFTLTSLLVLMFGPGFFSIDTFFRNSIES